MIRGAVGPWGAVPLELVKDARLTRQDIAVYVALSYRRGNNETMWASIQTIADDVGIEKHNVYRHFRKLKTCGWIIPGPIDKKLGTRHYAVLMPLGGVKADTQTNDPGVKADTGKPFRGVKADTGGVSRLTPKENTLTQHNTKRTGGAALKLLKRELGL